MRFLSRLITRYPWFVLLAWGLIALLSLPLAARAPARLTAEPSSGLKYSESAAVSEILKNKFGENNGNFVLLVSSSQPALNTAQGLKHYQDFTAGLAKVKGVQQVIAAQSGGLYSTRSPDSKVALTIAQIPVKEGAQQALKLIRQYTKTLNAVNSQALSIQVTGGQAIADDFTHFAEADTKRSEFTALPLIAVLLLLVFGSLVATGLPLIIGVLSITVAMAGLYGLTYVMGVSTFAQSVITMLGLGAGIDYALLMVNRFREELKKQNGNSIVAAERTIQTAGRSVAFSGVTVAIAMAGLIIPSVAFVRSIGVGGVLIVLLTVLASLTALPAMLTLLGERVNSPRILRISWAQSDSASAGWTAFARRVTGRPWLAIIVSAGILLLLAVPTLSMKTGYAGPWGLVAGVESRDALVEVNKLGAGGLMSQFEIVLDLKGQKYQPANRQQFQAVVTKLQALIGVKAVISPFLRAQDLAANSGGSFDAFSALNTLTRRSFSQGRTYLRLTVLPKTNLRADQIEVFEKNIRAVLDQSGYSYLVGGAPIGEKEFSHTIRDAFPVVVGTVFAGTFLLLMVAFRSILIPLKSILMNALTVGAAAGVVTLVVQDGFMANLIGIPSDVGILDASLPVLLFAIMFGLSMDYEIFLLSRVQEEHLRGTENKEAVILAVGHTARIITSAALIMFIVFTAFIFGRVVTSKSIGLGLAVAVVLDATLVRLVLVPAFLTLAGNWNWWLPAWLDRLLPKIKLEH